MGLLIKMNDLFYNLDESTYNETTHSYDALTITEDTSITQLLQSSTLVMSYLFSNVTIGEDTFRPIDKLDNFQFISDQNKRIIIGGRKSSKELIIMDEDITFDTSQVRTVDNIISEHTGDFKLVFSKDSGVTWMTYNNSSFSPLVSTHSDNEAFKEEILEKGIPSTSLGSVSFSKQINNKFRIAILIENDAVITSLKIKYTDINHHQKVDKSNVDIVVYDSLIRVTMKEATPHMYVNILLREEKISGPNDSRTRLLSPVLSYTINDNNLVTVNWEPVANAGSYKIYVNGKTVGTTNETSFTYQLENESVYNISARSYPSDATKFKESVFSSSVVLNMYKYLADSNGDFIAITFNGKQYKLKVVN